MGNGRRDFTQTASWQFAEQHQRQLTSDCGEGIAVKEKEWSFSVEALQEVERFSEGENRKPPLFPLRFARSSSLRINAVLRSTSFARSSVDADNRLPVPVLDKSGSGLKR